MNSPFEYVKLNEEGQYAATHVQNAFEIAWNKLSMLLVDGREKSLVLTKLQEASMFAKKSISLRAEYQDYQDHQKHE